jgi:hypothetical protein
VRGERGSLTIWLLGLSVTVLFLGGLSLDLWRVFNVRRDLAGLADAAAIAGAGALDESAWRQREELLLDPREASATARGFLGPRVAADAVVEVGAWPDRVAVSLSRTVRLPLIGLFSGGVTVPVHAHAVVRPARVP